MKIERIELRKIFLPYISPFKTSGWVEDGNHGIIVKIFSEGLTGWGEAPVSNMPWYIEETTSTAWAVMNENLSPLLLNNDINSPGDVDKLFSKIRGNNFAKAGLEFAVWDLLAKKNNKSLSEMLGGVQKEIAVGVSIGIQNSIKELIKTVEGYLQEGYKRIKIKIKPGWDIEPVKALRENFPEILLQVDANSAYSLSDTDHLKKLDEFNLLLIEQPLAHNDIIDHSRLQQKIKTPVCLDESITSPDYAGWAIEMDACRVINIKPARVGGLTAAVKIHDICRDAGIPVWCGGMLETGIGRAINAALASLPNFKLPGDISANSRYYKKDIVLNPFTLNQNGTLTVPNQPGHGAVVDEEYLKNITAESVFIK
ncbi:MAG: o-succinylbenzoate synthase [Ignavibacteriaceae bacterium]